MSTKKAPTRPTKKATPKATRLKTELELIEQEINTLGYIIKEDDHCDGLGYILYTNEEYEEDNDYNDFGDYYGDEVNRTNMYTDQQIPHCCGIIELGEFYLDRNKFTKAETNLKLATTLLTKYLFLQAKLNHTNISRNSNKPTATVKTQGSMVIFASNSSGDCLIAEEALNTMPQHYTRTNSIISNNSGNKITLYVGNYN